MGDNDSSDSDQIDYQAEAAKMMRALSRVMLNLDNPEPNMNATMLKIRLMGTLGLYYELRSVHSHQERRDQALAEHAAAMRELTTALTEHTEVLRSRFPE